MPNCLYCHSKIIAKHECWTIGRKYCNRECYRRGITNEQEKRILPKNCIVCKTLLVKGRREGIKRWNSRKFCGGVCRKMFHVGPKHPRWRGGRGYANQHTGRYVRVHDGKNSRVLEHRRIAEKALGRRLNPNEVVHHIDENKCNNANNNLLICNRGYHKWIHDEMGRLYAQERFGLQPSVADVLSGIAC